MTAKELPGYPLTAADLARLECVGISSDLSRKALLRRVDSLTGACIVGRTGRGNYQGLLFPYVWPGEEVVREFRLRRDEPDLEQLPDGRFKEIAKYLSPPGRGNMLYFVPGTRAAWLQDPTLPILITEGEKKCLALYSLGLFDINDATERMRWLSVGLSGVWNWRGVTGKTEGPDGSRLNVKGPIPDLDRLNWKNRRVTILFDSNCSSNPSVQLARRMLSSELVRRDAQVYFVDIPHDAGANGIDDLLGLWGPARCLRLIESHAYEPHDWRSKLLRTQKGAAKGLLANARLALKHAPEWMGCLAFDEFSQTVIIAGETPWDEQIGRQWTDDDDVLAADWLQRNGIPISTEVVSQAVQVVAREHSLHPVRDYLSNLQWDGVKRVRTWLRDYLGVEDSEYSREVGERWLIAAVARIFQPGVKADCCLILEGMQGIGKSAAIQKLGGRWATDEITEFGSKDASMQTRGVWLIELSELDSMGRAEASRIKAFISRTTDRFRPPYGRRVIESPRQCVFVGTCNHSGYLRDETGGRRFWPVPCTMIDLNSLEREGDHLWAETVHLYRGGTPWWLDKPHLISIAAVEQKDRYEDDPWDNAIAEFLNGRDDVSIDQIFKLCLGKELAIWSQSDKNRIARSLVAQGWKRFRARENGNREWRYRRSTTTGA